MHCNINIEVAPFVSQEAIDDLRSAVQSLTAAATLTPGQQLVEGAASLNSKLDDIQSGAQNGDKEKVASVGRAIANVGTSNSISFSSRVHGHRAYG